MTEPTVTISQARKLLGKTAKQLSDEQIAKMVKLLETLADYTLSFNAK